MTVMSKSINISFVLERYNGSQSRYTCPSCRHAKEFTRYINAESGEYVGEDVGMCNRKNKCGFHKPPREYFVEHKIFGRGTSLKPNLPVSSAPSPSSIDGSIVEATLKEYGRNN